MRIFRLDSSGGVVDELPEGRVLSCVSTEEVNSQHGIELVYNGSLAKGDRLLLKVDGNWREYAVASLEERGFGGNAIGTYDLTWTLKWDLQRFTVSRMPGVKTPADATTALSAALSSTPWWTVGTVEPETLTGASMYDMSAWEAIEVLLEHWGGELEASIAVGSTGVTSRSVNLLDAVGSPDVVARFDSESVGGICRTMGEAPFYMRVSPRGKGEESGDGYGRKITIASVNDGKDWLEDPDARESDIVTIGGASAYPVVIIENSAMETPADLKAWAQGVITDYTRPKVTYEIEGLDADLRLGDAVMVVDPSLKRAGNDDMDALGVDGLRVRTRVMRLSKDLLTRRVLSMELGAVLPWMGARQY